MTINFNLQDLCFGFLTSIQKPQASKPLSKYPSPKDMGSDTFQAGTLSDDLFDDLFDKTSDSKGENKSTLLQDLSSKDKSEIKDVLLYLKDYIESREAKLKNPRGDSIEIISARSFIVKKLNANSLN